MAEVTIHLDLDDRRDKLSYEYYNTQAAIHSFFEDLAIWIQVSRESKYSRPVHPESFVIPDKLASILLTKIIDMRCELDIEPLIQEGRCLLKQNCSCREDNTCTVCDRWA